MILMQDFDIIPASELSAVDLTQEAMELAKQGSAYELFAVEIEGSAEAASLLWVPDAGRAGVAHGADAQWTDAKDPHDAVRRFLADEMAP